MAKEGNKKMKWRRRIFDFLFYGIILFVLLNTTTRSWVLRGALITGFFSPDIGEVEAAGSYQAVPLAFRDESGAIQSTENMRGKVVFINFWASWCPPCVAEMPSINKMYSRLKDDPKMEFIFINLDDEDLRAINYLSKNDYKIPLQKPEGYLPTDFYTGTLPATVVLDKSGRIVMNHTGLADYNSKKFINQLEYLKRQ